MTHFWECKSKECNNNCIIVDVSLLNSDAPKENCLFFNFKTDWKRIYEKMSINRKY